MKKNKRPGKKYTRKNRRAQKWQNSQQPNREKKRFFPSLKTTKRIKEFHLIRY
jgi:hypothetical protein